MIGAELTGLLAWMETPGVGDRTLAKLLAERRRGGATLDELWQLPASDLEALFDLPARVAKALATDAPALWDRAEERAAAVRGLELDVLTPLDVDYPRRLRESRRSWPTLFTHGNLGLLEEPAVALLASADCAPEHLAAIDRLADGLARRDVLLVTGINRAPYQQAATAAKRHGSPTLMALDRGFLQEFPAGLGAEPVSTARVWDERLDPETQLLLSPFALNAGWVPRSGRRRDALICDLCAAMMAVRVRPGGGMSRECERAVRRGTPVLAAETGEGAPSGAAELREADARVEILNLGRTVESAVERILEALPGWSPDLAMQAREASWRREVRSFLLRAGRRLLAGRDEPLRWLARPANGPLAQWAEQSLGAGRRASGGGAALALVEASRRDSAKQLPAWAEQLEPGGVLAAAVPQAWLAESARSAARAALLEVGQVLAVVSLPSQEVDSEERAALFVQRSDGADAAATPAAVFAPEAERMSRHQLRRYLLQVLESLATDGRAG